MNDYTIKQYYEDPLSFCCRYEIIHFSYTLTEYFPENFEKNEKKCIYVKIKVYMTIVVWYNSTILNKQGI